MEPQWLDLAKNKLYDIKLTYQSWLIAKYGKNWKIGSSVYKILEWQQLVTDMLYNNVPVAVSILQQEHQVYFKSCIFQYEFYETLVV